MTSCLRKVAHWVNLYLMTRPYSLIASIIILLTLGCSKDPNAPDATTSLSGHWVTADTVDVFTGFDLQMAQSDDGLISGNWTAKTRIINGKCDAIFGCAPGNMLRGSNLSLKVTLAILGAGTYSAQLVTKDRLDGQIVRFEKSYRLRLHRIN